MFRNRVVAAEGIRLNLGIDGDQDSLGSGDRSARCHGGQCRNGDVGVAHRAAELSRRHISVERGEDLETSHVEGVGCAFQLADLPISKRLRRVVAEHVAFFLLALLERCEQRLGSSHRLVGQPECITGILSHSLR